MFEVYMYLDPRVTSTILIEGVTYNNEVIYVGKGKISDNRKLKHLTKCTNLLLKAKLEKIKACSLSPLVIVLKKFVHEGDALLFEQQLIQQIGRIDLKTGTLCNFTNGGEGHTGIKYTEKTLLRKSTTHKAWWATLTREQRSNIAKKVHSKFDHKLAARKASATRAKKTDKEKQSIEQKRRIKWEHSYRNRTDEQKKLTSIRCSIAASKPRGGRVFYTLKNIITNENITLSQYEWQIKYHIDSTVLKSRASGVTNKKIKSSSTGDVFIYYSHH